MALAKFAAFVVFSLAFLSRSDAFRRSIKPNVTPKENSTTDREPPENKFYLEIGTHKCRDSYARCTEKICHKYKGRSMKRIIKKICKKTCGHCRAFSPPACFSSKYGCCWNYLTSALGPGGKGCPPCDDSRRYPFICQRFQTYCRRRGISGVWMRGHCPDACGHCAIWQF